MSDKHSVSRRATLKSLGAAGAMVVVGGAVPASTQTGPKPAGGGQDAKPASVVDLAAERMAKGHS